MTGRQEAEIVGYPVATRWPWSADVDYMEATARQYDEDKTEANRNAFLWASLRPVSAHHFRCSSLGFLFGE